MDEVRIGVIGAGVLGSYHLGKCLMNKDVRLCGFYDANPDRRRAVNDTFSVKAYSGLADLIGDVQALIIATPCSSHYEIALQCLGAGKHALIEKPLAASYREGAELVAMAQEKDVILHVGHSEAFNAAFTRLQSLQPVPRFIEVHRLALYSPRGTDVPVVLDLMVHDLQLIMRLCGEEPIYERIAATGVPVISHDIDIANVRMAFPSGCVANLTASRISAKRMRKIRIFAPGNYFSVNLDKGEIDRYSLTPDAGAPGGTPFTFAQEKVAAIDALEMELRAFVEDIREKTNRRGVGGKEALVVLKAADVILGLLSSGKKS
jgi:predicted dehydrogenase